MKIQMIITLLAILLLTACANRDPERVGFLDMTVYEMFPNDQQLRALAQAAASGDIKAIDRLVADGVDVNAVGGRGLPPAYWVLYHPNKDGLKRLCEHGVNPNIILTTSFWNRERHDSLMHAAARSSLYRGSECLQVLLKYGGGNPNLEIPIEGHRPIAYTTFKKTEEAFVLLYKYGADIDYHDKYASLLKYALSSSNYELALFLLEQGVDYAYVDPVGHSIASSLGMASKYQSWTREKLKWYWRCVDFLENKGVEIDFKAELQRPESLDTNPPRILKMINKR